jgi:hypothetical protein
LNYLIAAVWLGNGLFCKVLNFVPRHEQIVARILGEDYSRVLIVLIGCGEIAIVIWVLTGIQKRLGAVTQIFLVTTMNILEFILAPDLLLWGRANALFAFIFVLIVYYNEFVINEKVKKQA